MDKYIYNDMVKIDFFKKNKKEPGKEIKSYLITYRKDNKTWHSGIHLQSQHLEAEAGDCKFKASPGCTVRPWFDSNVGTGERLISL